jgi:hypothetical protein
MIGVLLTAGCAGIERALQPGIAASRADNDPVSVDQGGGPCRPPRRRRWARNTADQAPQPRVVPSVPPAGCGQGHCAAAQGAREALQRHRLRRRAKSEPPAAAPTGRPRRLDLVARNPAKETQAIGVFTKLTLKNQIDELLDWFRAFTRAGQDHAGRLATLVRHAGAQGAGPAAGRRPTPGQRHRGLAEAIWGILSNPAKFSAV